MSISVSELQSFPIAGKGHFYEDFQTAAVFVHERGRTLKAADNTLFNTLTIQLNARYFDAALATSEGHTQIPLQPWLVFSTVFGLSVEDLSEKGGAFLGIDDLEFRGPAYPGVTLRARSTVREIRRSAKNPGFGIVTWFTEGLDAEGRILLSFTRTNMVVARERMEAGAAV